MRYVRAACLGLLTTAAATSALAQDDAGAERIIVTAIRPERPEPAPGAQVIEPGDAIAGGLPSLGDLLARQGESVTIAEPQGNPFQPELSYRGYSVSGLLGLPQGLALYQNGVRVNEAFGDVVNFDVLPEAAIDHVTITSGANPLFGLNALGGAVSTTMKSGFTFNDAALEVSGGHFGRAELTAEAGGNDGRWAGYGAVTRLEEDGWRDHSPSRVTQAYGDLARRFESGELGVSLTLADTDLNGNGAAPFDLLEADRQAVFTYPDNTRNRLAFLQARGDVDLSPALRLEGVAYARLADQKTLNGDETDVEACGGDDADDEDAEDGDAEDGDAEDGDAEDGDADAMLCEEDGEGYPVLDLAGEPIAAGAVGDEPFAVFNRTRTQTDAYGASLQAVLAGRDGGLLDELVLGGDVEVANTDFASSTELGELTEDRTVDPSGVFIKGDEFQTGLKAKTTNWSAFGAAAFGLTDALQLTLSGRYVRTEIDLEDQIGDALDGDHAFDRFNPAVELAWRPETAGGRFEVFGRYGESSRTPTPAELACADPEQPCRFPNAFVADPPLKQVAAKAAELGVSSEAAAGAGRLRWSATAFTARNEDDIIFVSSGPVVGSGYFRNAGETKREGLEAAARWTLDRLTLSGSWTYVSATFEDSLTLLSDSNPAADDDGEITVRPGDRIPLIPAHSGRVSASFALTDWLDVEGTVLATSDRVFRGDEGGDAAKIGGFARLDLGASARLGERVRAFLRIENALDEDFSTFGTYGDAEEVFLREAPDAADPRFLTPAAPRGVFVGLRVKL